MRTPNRGVVVSVAAIALPACAFGASDPATPPPAPAQVQAQSEGNSAQTPDQNQDGARAAAVAEVAAPADAASGQLPQTKKPNPLGLPEGWSGALELGLNGSDGNTQNFNMRTALDLNRKVGLADSTLRLTYRRSAEGGDVNANRFVADGRHVQRFSETSPWSMFISGTYEYDDFQDWRQRLTLNAGVGYDFVDTRETKLTGRVGAGANRRWGGADENWTPEGLFGLMFEHKLSERTSVYGGVEVLPDISSSGEFRVNAKGGMKVIVDPELGLNLHIGFEDRYDSNPGPGSKANDVDYFVLLGWKF
jgi:putative salt-induced outer membrane protein YdiY